MLNFWIILYTLYDIYLKIVVLLIPNSITALTNLLLLSETHFLAVMLTPKCYSYYTWLDYLIQLRHWGCL